MKERAAKPTQADKAAAMRLKAVWIAKAKGLGLTQLKAAPLLDMTQPAVSQYLNGEIPLGFDALMKFASLLGFKPLDVRDDLPEQKHLPKPETVLSKRQEQNHIIALQLTIRSLVKALAGNIQAAGPAFADHLEAQARELKFSDGSGLLGEVIDIAVPGRHKTAAAGRPRKRQGSAA